VIAFLGTGLMGRPMAERLLAAGHEVRLWNRSVGKLAALQRIGGLPCRTPAQAARGAAFVCLCLTDAAAVESVIFGPDGVIETLPSNAVIVDFSTIGPTPTRALAERASHLREHIWLDCPVSGGVAGAEAGTLSILAGGAPLALDRAMPLLRTFARRVTHMGPTGAGQAAKLCNQLIVSTNMLAIAEAMHVGEALGLDVSRLPLALEGGFADSRPLQIFGPRMAPAADPDPAVSELKTMYKDIGAVRIAAAAAGAVVPLLERVEALYGTLIEAGLGAEDVPALMRLYRNHLITTGASDGSH
jgi:3-hydroxyisobutyrate dehydrogenase-like beta-hydroxyacid dehydrogenase